jgi:hypothetical protein
MKKCRASCHAEYPLMEYCKSYVSEARFAELEAKFEALKRTPGPKGERGADGENGKDGKDGENGKDGKDGENGKDGQDGENGKDGTNGKDGENGKDGVDGVDGVDGKGGGGGELSCDDVAKCFEAPAECASAPLCLVK